MLKVCIEILNKLIPEKLDLAQSDKIFLVQPDDLYLFFEQHIKEGPIQSTEKIVKGYRVKIE